MGKFLKCFISIVFLAGLVGVFFWPLLCGKEVFYFGDFLGFFYPLRQYAASSFRSLEIPLWNPYILSGTPFLANWHSACLYPLSIIYYLAPFRIGFHIFVVAHYFLGALFMYLLARNWLKNDICALVAGVAFGFSGYLISISDYTNALSSIIWIPLILLFFEKALDARSWRYAVWAGLAFAVQILAGGPEPVGFTLLFLLIYTFAWEGRRVFLKKRVPSRAFLYLVLVLVISFSLSAIQMVPFGELFFHSERRVWVGQEISSLWSASPLTLIRLVFPYFWARPGKWGIAWDGQFWLKSGYLGIVTLLLAFFAFFTVPRWRTYLYGFTALLFLSLSLGDWTPLWSLAHRFVPGFSPIRFPVKFLGGVALCVSLLAGAGAQSLLGFLKQKRFLRRLFFLLASAGLFLILLGIGGYFCQGILPSHITGRPAGADSRPGVAEHPEISKAYISTVQSFGRTGLFLLLVGGVLLYGMTRKAKTFLVAALFLGLILLDLLGFAGGSFRAPLLTPGYGLMFTTSPEIYEKTPATAKYILRQEGLFRVYCRLFFYLRTYPLQKPEDIIEPRMEALGHNICMLYGISRVDGFEALMIKDYETIHRPVENMPPVAGEKWLDFVGARFIIKTLKVKEPFTRAALPRVRGNEDALARAFLVYESEILPQEEILARILNGRWEPERMVFLEEVPQILEKEPTVAGLDTRSTLKDEVKIIKWAPKEEIMDVTTPEAAFLVISEAFYPGWKAEIEGKPTKIYRANYAFRALSIPAGSHRVRIFYSPLSFKIGLGGSLVGLSLTSLLLLWPRRRKGEMTE